MAEEDDSIQENEESPLVKLSEVCGRFGYTYASAKKANSRGKFPIKVIRLNRTLYCDRRTVEAFFEQIHTESMAELRTEEEDAAHGV